jgi:hypothetical protein
MNAAFVVDPAQPIDVPKLAAEDDRKAAFEATKLAVIRGTDTRIPQVVPPGTTEAAVPAMESEVADLRSKDFFLKTLDRPHYAGEDANGIPPWDRGSGYATPPKPQQPKQQARGEGSVVAAQ